MLKIRKIIAISIMATMLFSTMGIGAFAATDTDLNINQDPEFQGQEQDLEEDSDTQGDDSTVAEDTITNFQLKQIDNTVSMTWEATGVETFNVLEKTGVDEETGNSIWTSLTGDTPISNKTFLTADMTEGIHTFKVESADAYEVAEDVPYAEEEITILTPIADLEAFSGYKSIHLEWSKVEGATKYCVYQVDPTGDLDDILFEEVPQIETGDVVTYKAIDIPENVDYSYKVSYVKEIDSSAVESIPSNVVVDQCVKPMYIYVTLKMTRTLTCHDDNDKLTVKFKKGARLTTCGFVSGRYKFYYQGHVFFVSKISTKNRVAGYWKNSTGTYSVKEAEYFVNDTGFISSTSMLIWASQRAQHVYVFKGSAGNWECIEDWECATGRSNSPTPATMYKKIGKKIRSRHNLPYWSCFSTLTAFHGKFSSWKVGAPISGGCIRNVNSDAYYIYKNVPKTTRTLIF